jgi:hypothetical protein
MTINVNSALNFLRQVSAYLGVFLTTTNAVHFPGNFRETLLAASSLLLTVEHLNVKTAKVAAAQQSPVA